MVKVEVKISGGDLWIHFFDNSNQATAYILGVREMDAVSRPYECSWIMSIHVDGKEV